MAWHRASAKIIIGGQWRGMQLINGLALESVINGGGVIINIIVMKIETGNIFGESQQWRESCQ
jgi:polygalacturonase